MKPGSKAREFTFIQGRFFMNFQDYIDRGMMFFQDRDYDQAIENWEAALNLDPGNVQLREVIEETKLAARDKAIADHYTTMANNLRRGLHTSYED
jgi:tetratricopeptide (TPR) repeat protein